MTPLDFLAAVLPSPGHGFYCTAELSSKKKEHVYVENLTEFEHVNSKWLSREQDVYFALSTFRDNKSRTADNAQWVKSIFIDMDGYASKKDAAQALSTFMVKTGFDALGTPWLVGSGGGLHGYWPFTHAVEVALWKPVAENFKRLCKQEGLAIDMTVTADAARVLRVPGTMNFKAKYVTPRPVKLMTEGDTFDFDEFAGNVLAHLKTPAFAAPVVESGIAGVRPKRAPDASGVKLIENSATKFATIWMKTEEGGGCAQLKNYVDNAVDDGMEPIWRGLLSWAQKCEDGPDYAKWLSEMHPYDEARMYQKLGEIKGPYACAKMDSENPGVCTTCSNWGKITNPLVLGREISTDNTAKAITINLATDGDVEDSEGEIDVSVQTVFRPKPPRGFSYGTHGGVYCERDVEDGDGKKSKKQIQVLAYDLFVVDILKQESEHLIHMVAVRPDGARTLNFPTKSIVSKDETLKWLASQNIVASFGKGNHVNLYDYVLGCYEECSNMKKVIEVPLQCGWQKDDSLVYNYRVFSKDGRETTIPMPGLENINKNTNSKGTLDGWRKFWNLMIEKQQYTMLAMCMDSFGCPLMRFTEYDGFVWHIGSTESGTGKSLTLAAKAGVWGHPTRYRTGKGTSPVAMQQRAGLLNSFPLLIDEITSKSRGDLEWVPSLIFDVTEGQGKERMESSANKERINNSTWSLTCTLTSNTHLTDYMSGARKHSSNGELLRMLEWTPNKALVFSPEEHLILKEIQQNYGVAGEAWVRWLATHQDECRAMVGKIHAKLKVEMGFTDDERYWHAGCTGTVAAAVLLGSGYANILDVPVMGIVAALKELVVKARSSLKRNQRTAEDVLNTYTRDNYGSFVVIKKAEGRILTAWGDGTEVDKASTRSKVLGRVEHNILRPGYVEYYIEEQLLKQHCVSMSFGYADFKSQLEAVHSVTYIKKDMLARTTGPSMRVNTMHITRKADEVDEDTVPVAQVTTG